MATVTEIARDTAAFVEREMRSSFTAFMREVAYLNDNAKVTPFFTCHEVAYLSDAAYPNFYPVLREVAYLNDHAYPSVHITTDTREVAYLSDAAYPSIVTREDVREVAYLDDRAFSNPTFTVREVAYLNDHVHWYGSGVTLREVARLSDKAYPGSGAVLREVAHFNDNAFYNLHPTVVVREIARLGDSVVLQITTDDVLREVAYLSDHAYPRVVWSGTGAVLHDIFYADDRAFPPPTGRAYTCHIVNWGMSEYANYPFLTHAKNFAAGQNLWRLDAVNDYGQPVKSWLTTGKLDLGVAGGKRPAAIYASGSSLEPLDVIVTGDVNGVLMSYKYTLDLRDQRDYRNNKAILGKGFRSRYLQFTLRAPKYLAVRLLTAEVDLAASQRRVG